MNNLKKIVLSFFTIAAFVSYAFYQQRIPGLQTIQPMVNLPATNISETDNEAKLENEEDEDRDENEEETNTPVVNVPPADTPVAPENNLPPVSAPATSTPIIGQYKDGEYIGISADNRHGNIQVKAIIKDGRIVDVLFLDYPIKPKLSADINAKAIPVLTAEAIHAQSAQVDIITGATDTCGAFITSLDSALKQAL